MLRRLLKALHLRRRAERPLDCTGPATAYAHHAGAYGNQQRSRYDQDHAANASMWRRLRATGWPGLALAAIVIVPTIAGILRDRW